MLELTMTVAGPGLIHRPASPMAYLDHWALMMFAGDARLSARLTTALHARDGSLALSWVNLGEYATVSDRQQRLDAEQLVEGLLPAIFCIEAEPFQVVARERAGDPYPHADRALATALLRLASGTVRPFTAKGLFDRLYDAGLAGTRERLATTVQGRLEELRQTHSTDREFRRAVDRADRAPDAQAVTPMLAIARTLVATFFPDLRRPITQNDVIDFLHAAIPVAYCDAVLLDGGTADRVERARRRLGGVRMATVFSGRGDGIDRFLANLEGA